MVQEPQLSTLASEFDYTLFTSFINKNYFNSNLTLFYYLLIKFLQMQELVGFELPLNAKIFLKVLDGGPAYQLQNLYAGATHTVDDDHMHGADEYLQNLLNLKPLVPIT